MATIPAFAAAGYQFEASPDLSRLETRERLSQPALDGLLAIADKWRLPVDKIGELLGGVPRSTLYKMKTAAGTLLQDQLTRISYIVGIYKSLHILLPADYADRWMSQPNDNFLFGGRPPLEYAIRNGVPGMQQIRSLLDAARGGS
ncbi:MAG TPA: MbcA/ParS/Xre antitoxin family protein [Terracidiphilus sp.]|jgi:hypothetical protein